MQVICRCSNSFDKSQSKHNWGGVILFKLLKWFEFFKSFCTFCLLCRNQVSGVKFLESEIPSIFLQVPFLQWINIQTGLNCYKILLNFNSWNYKEYYWTPLKSVWQIQGMCIIFGENVYSYKLIFMDKLKRTHTIWLTYTGHLDERIFSNNILVYPAVLHFLTILSSLNINTILILTGWN